MKNALQTLLAALLLMMGSAVWAAHHVNGVWKLDVTLGGQAAGTATFDLTEEDGKLTGTYTGGAGSAEVTGTVNGNDVEFSFDSQAGKVTYKGTVSGDTMSGSCSYGMMGEGSFEGSKEEA